MKIDVSKKKQFLSVMVVLLVLLGGIFLGYLGYKQIKLKYEDYKVTDCIYLTLASSSSDLEKERIKQNRVSILEDSFQMTNPEITITDVTYKIEKMSPKVIENLEKYHLPISDYQNKRVCSIYTYDGKREEPYELYLLDDAIWLAVFPKYPEGTAFYSISVLEYVD